MISSGNTKVVEPNKGRHIAVSGTINTIVASKEDTGGTYSFIEAKVFPGGGVLAPHVQTREHEGFYVVEGQITFNKLPLRNLKLCFSCSMISIILANLLF